MAARRKPAAGPAHEAAAEQPATTDPAPEAEPAVQEKPKRRRRPEWMVPTGDGMVPERKTTR